MPCTAKGGNGTMPHRRAVWVAGALRVRDGVVLGADFGALRARTHAAARRLWSL